MRRWRSGESQLVVKKLHKGLGKHPGVVALNSMTGALYAHVATLRKRLRKLLRILIEENIT